MNIDIKKLEEESKQLEIESEEIKEMLRKL